jgi:hypothetical protein
MALIKCPDCGNEVSDKAEKCPKCAYPINPTTPLKPQVIEQKINVEGGKEGCFLQTMNMGCGCLTMIIVIIILALALKGCR